MRNDVVEQPCLDMPDDVVVEPGEIARVVTTGSGWGDPLEREAEPVAYDVTTGLAQASSGFGRARNA